MDENKKKEELNDELLEQEESHRSQVFCFREKEELNDKLLEQVSGGNFFTDRPKFIPEPRQKERPQG